MRLFIGLLLVLPLLSACSSKSADLRCESATTSAPFLNETFNLRYQDSATIQGENLRLVFSEVDGDSRCPVDVQCITEGNARVEVTATRSPDAAQVLTLNTSGALATQASYLNYQVTLLSVVPYPESTHPINTADYCLSLRVSKNA